MSFLSGLFLLALPLAFVPLLIHLYRGRQRDVILWGATQFLEKALTKGRSWERLEEILLMLLRTAALLALIFALARPLVNSSWWGSHGRREVVLLLDNSLSMAREVADVTAGDQLREQAVQLLSDLTAEDRVHVMLTAGGGVWLTPEGIPADRAGIEKLTSLVESVEPSRGAADLLSCLLTVTQMETHDNSKSRRVVVFTDDQQRSWQLDAEQAWQQLRRTIDDASIATSVQVVGCGAPAAPVDNLAVTALQVTQQIVRPGEQVECQAEIANLGQEPQTGSVVKWLVNDEEVATSDLAATVSGETVQVARKIRLQESGPTLIACRLEALDQLPLDQEAQTVVEVTDEIPVLVIHDPEDQPVERSARDFLSAALGYNGGRPLDWHSIYRPTFIASSALPEANLAAYRAIVVTNLSNWEEDTTGKVADFVRAGGGLWLALGDRIERGSFNRTFFDDGDGLCPLSLESLHESQGLDEEGGLIHPPDQEHPATAQLGNVTQLDIDEARVLVRWQFAPRIEDGGTTDVLLETGSGNPLAIENYWGKGRVIVQSFPLGLEWSNLPRLKSYVVMVTDWLDYLTAPSSLRFNLAPGNPLVAVLPSAADASSVKLLLPAGNTVELISERQDDSQIVRYWQTQLPGTYCVRYEQAGRENRIFYQVARDRAESQLTFIDDQQRKLLSNAGLIYGDKLVVEHAAKNEVTEREPVWSTLLICVIVFFALELILSSWLTGYRTAAPLSEQVA